jgi:hypothetical protein
MKCRHCPANPDLNSQVLAECNHHIGNGLQCILAALEVLDGDRQAEEIRKQVKRIDAARRGCGRL